MIRYISILLAVVLAIFSVGCQTLCALYPELPFCEEGAKPPSPPEAPDEPLSPPEPPKVPDEPLSPPEAPDEPLSPPEVPEPPGDPVEPPDEPVEPPDNPGLPWPPFPPIPAPQPDELDDFAGKLRCLMITDGLLYNDRGAVDSLGLRISKDWRYNCLMAMTAFGPRSGNSRDHIFTGCDENGNPDPKLLRNIRAIEKHGVWVVPIIRCGYCYSHNNCGKTPIMDCGNAYSSSANFNAAVNHVRKLLDSHPKIPAIQVELEAKEGVEWSRRFIRAVRDFYDGDFIVSIIGSRQRDAERMANEMGADVLSGPSDINCWTRLAGANRDFLHGDGADLCNYSGGLDQLCKDLQNRNRHYAVWPRDGVMGYVPHKWLRPTAVLSIHAAAYSGPITDEQRP